MALKWWAVTGSASNDHLINYVNGVSTKGNVEEIHGLNADFIPCKPGMGRTWHLTEATT